MRQLTATRIGSVESNGDTTEEVNSALYIVYLLHRNRMNEYGLSISSFSFLIRKQEFGDEIKTAKVAIHKHND